ncbi:hypothetical protein [Thorsellia kenyensis]|uniref:DUF4153 domain-containing protein n=1 Tax=Thorsellia kenyensis TaxID=1549888 RepID=A0ABV6C9C3_9GAMM
MSVSQVTKRLDKELLIAAIMGFLIWQLLTLTDYLTATKSISYPVLVHGMLFLFTFSLLITAPQKISDVFIHFLMPATLFLISAFSIEQSSSYPQLPKSLITFLIGLFLITIQNVFIRFYKKKKEKSFVNIIQIVISKILFTCFSSFITFTLCFIFLGLIDPALIFSSITTIFLPLFILAYFFSVAEKNSKIIVTISKIHQAIGYYLNPLALIASNLYLLIAVFYLYRSYFSIEQHSNSIDSITLARMQIFYLICLFCYLISLKPSDLMNTKKGRYKFKACLFVLSCFHFCIILTLSWFNLSPENTISLNSAYWRIVNVWIFICALLSAIYYVKIAIFLILYYLRNQKFDISFSNPQSSITSLSENDGAHPLSSESQYNCFYKVKYIYWTIAFLITFIILSFELFIALDKDERKAKNKDSKVILQANLASDDMKKISDLDLKKQKMMNQGNNIFALEGTNLSKEEFDAIIGYLDKFTIYECLTKYSDYKLAKVKEPTCFIQVIYPYKNQPNKPIYAIFYYHDPLILPIPSKLLSINSQTFEVTLKEFHVTDANEYAVLHQDKIIINSPEEYKEAIKQGFKKLEPDFQTVSFLGDIFYINHMKAYKEPITEENHEK